MKAIYCIRGHCMQICHQASCFCGYRASLMTMFSLAQSNGQFAYLLWHIVLFKANTPSANETELWGKRLYLEALEDLVHRGQGVGMPSWLCPQSVRQWDTFSPAFCWHWHAHGMGPTDSVPSLGPLCNQSANEHRMTTVVERGQRSSWGAMGQDHFYCHPSQPNHKTVM